MAVPALSASPEYPPETGTIRVLTWKGYVTPGDQAEVNRILADRGYPYRVEVMTPFADNANQMFDLMRRGACDVTFLTLYFIKLQDGRAAKLLRPIDLDSPRLDNSRKLLKSLNGLPMGMTPEGKQLYIPFGGGAYGFWADMSRLRPDELPRSFKDLLDPKWKGRISLNITQPYYNIALCLMALGRQPFEINDLVSQGRRSDAKAFVDPTNQLQQTLDALYANAGNFWTDGTEFRDHLRIVSSWGPEMARANEAGGKWRLINFRERNLVWLDTINFMATLEGRKLEAAEIFANYCIGKTVQNRVVRQLSMVAASSLADVNPLVDANPGFFAGDRFIPSFTMIADNIMRLMSDNALARARESR